MPTRGDLEPSTELESSASDALADFGEWDEHSHKGLDGSDLPSPEDCLASTWPILYQVGEERTIKHMSNHVLVKYGSPAFITIDEGLAMQLAGRYIAEVPRFIGYYTHQGKAFLFMSFIQGVRLSALVFSNLEPEQRLALISSLHQIITTLAAIPVPPSARIGGLSGRSAGLLLPPSIPPPALDTQAEMVEFLAGIIDSRCTASPIPAALRRMSTSAPLQFVHGDIAGRNILVYNGELAGVVDWEWGGWYPAPFEAARGIVEETCSPSAVSSLVLELCGGRSEESQTLADYYISVD